MSLYRDLVLTPTREAIAAARATGKRLGDYTSKAGDLTTRAIVCPAPIGAAMPYVVVLLSGLGGTLMSPVIAPQPVACDREGRELANALLIAAPNLYL